MRSNTHPLRLSIVLTRPLKLAVLVGGMLLTANCVTPVKPPAATYDPANRGSDGEFVITGGNMNGRATLPSEVPYYTTIPEFQGRAAPVLGWEYRYHYQVWDEVDGTHWHESEWKSLGTDGQGHPACELIVRPSEIPEWNGGTAGATYDFTCETRARFRTLDGKREKSVELPIPVSLTIPE